MATLTADLCLVLLIFGGIFDSASANDNPHEITAKSGDNVTLHCQSPRDADIKVLDWSRPDLETDDHVFFYRNKRPYEHYQHPSFRGRVQLKDPEMKDRDVSVILKNVNFNDTGTYQCYVSVKGIELICTINLKVVPPDPQELTVKSGDNVILQCQSPRGANITQLHWIRPDLKPDYVFFLRENRPYENYQHPSFRGRVQLRDPEMKDGDVSVILKNININDAGTYECRVSVNGKGLELTNTINMTVEDSAGNTGPNVPLIVGLAGTAVAAVVGFVGYMIYKMKTNSYSLLAEEAGDQQISKK